MRYFISLSYDGAAYHGWQVQPNDTTVQQRLDEALSTLLRASVPTVGAGRTDAGVNASCMVAHFDCDTLPSPPEQLVYKLNRLLPPDIAVHDIRPVRADAHARFSALARTYHYYVCTEKSPFHRRYAMRLPFAVDFKKMNRASEILLQTEDFTSFSKLHTDTKTNICHLTAAHWDEQEPGLWRFTITADRFLRNMVRAIVGTLLDIGRGKTTEADLHRIIDAYDRCSAGDSVMGEALFLADVRYPDDIYLTPVRDKL